MIVLNLGIAIAKHGEPEKGKHSAWTTLFGAVITMAILWWGGFFG
jgi:hypothetical protein